jgi:hypothetical protein
MRNWAKHSRRYSIVKVNSNSSNQTDTKRERDGSNQDGPEVLLSPSLSQDKYPMEVKDRARSSGSITGEQHSSPDPKSRCNSVSRRRIWNEMCADDARQQDDEKPTPQPFAIPVCDIVVVDSMGSGSNGNCPVFLTTQSAGYFEFTFNTSNAHDVFLAFLTNSLPYERIIRSCTTPLDAHSTSFDVETLTATRMQRRVEAETMTEKVMRKLNLMANRIGEREYPLLVVVMPKSKFFASMFSNSRALQSPPLCRNALATAIMRNPLLVTGTIPFARAHLAILNFLLNSKLKCLRQRLYDSR